MKCPKCGENNSQIINEVTSTGKDFSAGKGCCGAILLGPICIKNVAQKILGMQVLVFFCLNHQILLQSKE